MSVDRRGGFGVRRINPSRVIQRRTEVVALANELLNAFSQTGSALLDIGPESIAPEGIFADGDFQRIQPALETRACACQLRGDGDESDGRLGV